MNDLQSTDALSELTFGMCVLVFLLLWITFSLVPAIFIIAAVFLIGCVVSSSDSPDMFYTLSGIGICTLFFMYIF